MRVLKIQSVDQRFVNPEHIRHRKRVARKFFLPFGNQGAKRISFRPAETFKKMGVIEIPFRQAKRVGISGNFRRFDKSFVILDLSPGKKGSEKENSEEVDYFHFYLFFE